MNDQLISIVVPVYKVESYLERCVRSILAQTHKTLEVILVDDGSPDRCGQICDAFAAEDPRVKVIHKENGGLSSARNAGLDAASGAYVGFVDSDDHIHPRMYEKLLQALEENAADVSICNYAYVDMQDNVDESKQAISPIKNGILDRKQGLGWLNVQVPGYSFFVTAWNKLYRKDLFQTLRFAEGKLHEDEFLAHHLLARCSRLVTVEDVLYYYVQRSGSIMSTKLSARSLDIIDAMYDRSRFFLSEKEPQLAKDMVIAMYGKMLQVMPKLKEKEARPAVWSAVKLVAKELLRMKDLRAAKLLLLWAKNRLC